MTSSDTLARSLSVVGTDRLARHLLLLDKRDATKTIVFSGIDDGAGSAEISLRAAQSLANQVDGSVCLVDANWTAPSLHEVLGLPNHIGFAQMVVSALPIRHYARITNGTNLSLLPSGVLPPNPTRRDIWKRIVDRTRELARTFDFVLVNAPAVNPLADASLSSRLSLCLREAFLAHLDVKCRFESIWPDMTNEQEQEYVRGLFEGASPPKVTLFSGGGDARDCSHVCARAGAALAARSKGLVCVVDGNIRNPYLHEYFGLENQPGLLGAVFNSAWTRKYMHQVSPGNLWVIPAGSFDSTLGSSLPWDRMRVAVEELTSEFDYVIIDAPPLNGCCEAHLLAQLSDGFIVVVAAERTRRYSAMQAIEELRRNCPRSIAAVLSGATAPIPDNVYRWLFTPGPGQARQRSHRSSWGA